MYSNSGTKANSSYICNTDFAKPIVFKFNNKSFLNNDLSFMNYFVTLQTDNF